MKIIGLSARYDSGDVDLYFGDKFVETIPVYRDRFYGEGETEYVEETVTVFLREKLGL